MTDAVIVIDMLKDFVSGKLKCKRAERIIPNLQKLLESARENDVPVIYSGDAHKENDRELDVWGPHGMEGTEGAETIEELKPTEKDYEVPKTTYSAFYKTGLQELLQKLGVDRVIITGLHTNVCDRHTAAAAFFRGYKIAVPEDGVEAFTEEDHKNGLEYLKKIYGAEITTTKKLIEEWSE